MNKLGLALCLVLGVACKSSTTSQPNPPPMTEPAATPEPTAEPAPTPTPNPTPTPTPTPTPAEPPATPTQTTPTTPPRTGGLKPAMGANCGDGDTCASGLECVKYYGIAGARGPQFKTCEHTCNDKKPCPSGNKCVTIADGPGQVCRAI